MTSPPSCWRFTGGGRPLPTCARPWSHLLAVHVPIIGLALLPVLFGLPLVLAPLHIAFLELVIDPAYPIVFEAEEGDADLMQQPPRAANEPLLVRPPHPAERAAGQRGDRCRGTCMPGC